MFAILDNGGNALSWYQDEGAARESLARMVYGSPAAAEHVVALEFDDEGDPVGDPILPPQAEVTVEASRWLVTGAVLLQYAPIVGASASAPSLEPIPT